MKIRDSLKLHIHILLLLGLYFLVACTSEVSRTFSTSTATYTEEPTLQVQKTLSVADEIESSTDLTSTVLPPKTQEMTLESQGVSSAGSRTLFTDIDYGGPDAMIELDAGPYNADILSYSGPDLFFTINTDFENLYFLEPINGSFAYMNDSQELTIDTCKQQLSSFSARAIPIASVASTGITFCVLTNQARLSLIQVEELSPFSSPSVFISYMTWDESFSNDLVALATLFPMTPTIPPTPTRLEEPTTTPEPGQVIIVNGSITLPVQFYQLGTREPEVALDLDTGELTIGTGSDIVYRVSCGSDCFFSISAINSSSTLDFGRQQPTPNDCFGLLVDFGPYIVSPEANSYGCVLTNQNHISILKVEELDATSLEGWVEISYTTYQLIVP